MIGSDRFTSYHTEQPSASINSAVVCAEPAGFGGAATHLSRGSRGGGRGGTGAILQGEVCNEDDELGERPSDLGAGALQQVLREAVGVGKQDVVCKPVAYILAVSQKDAEAIIPRGSETHSQYGT